MQDLQQNLRTTGLTSYAPPSTRLSGSSFRLPSLQQTLSGMNYSKLLTPYAPQRLGIWKQFGLGTISLVTGVGSKLGLMDKPQRPQGTGEIIANVLGTIVGSIPLIALTKFTAGVALAPLLKAMNVAGSVSTKASMVGAASAAGKAVTAAQIAKMVPTGAKIAESVLTGAQLGAVQGWLQDEDIAKSALTTGAIYGAFPAIGAGFKAGKLALQRAGTISSKGASVSTAVKEPFVKAAFTRHGEQAALAKVKKLYKDIGQVISDTDAEASARKVLDNLGTITKTDLNSFLASKDVGQAGIKEFLKKSAVDQLRDITIMATSEKYVDSLVRPMMGYATQGMLSQKGDVGIKAMEILGSVKNLKTPLNTDTVKQFGKVAVSTGKGQPKQAMFFGLKSLDKNINAYMNAKTSLDQTIALKNLISQGEGILKSAGKKKAKDLAAYTTKYFNRDKQIADMVSLARRSQYQITGQVSGLMQKGILTNNNMHSVALIKRELTTPHAHRAIKLGDGYNFDKVYHEDVTKVLDKIQQQFPELSVLNYDDPNKFIAQFVQAGKSLGLPEKELKALTALNTELQGTVKRLGSKAIQAKKIISLLPDEPELRGKALAQEVRAFMSNNPNYIKFSKAAEIKEATIPLWDRKFSPARYLIGETNADRLRDAKMSKDIYADYRMSTIRSMQAEAKKAGITNTSKIMGILESAENDKIIKRFINMDTKKVMEDRIPELAKELGISVPEAKIVATTRSLFETIFTEAGIDYDKYIEGYLPHFKNLFKKRVNVSSGISDLKKSLFRAGMDKDKIQDYMWVNELTRDVNSVLPEGASLWDMMERYVMGASKKIHYQKVLQHMNKTFAKDKTAAGEIRRAAVEKIRDRLMYTPGPIEKQMDAGINFILKMFGAEKLSSGKPMSEFVGMVTELQILGGLGFNPFSAAKNLTQKILPIVQLGEGNPIKGMKLYADYKALPKATKQAIQAMNDVLNHRIYHEGLELTNSAVQGFLKRIPGGTKISQGYGKYRDASMQMFKMADQSNVKDSFGMAYLKAVKDGYGVMEAKEFALSSTMATQFMYGIDGPLMFAGSGGRFLGTFMSWPLNWAKLLYEEAVTLGDVQTAVATVGAMAIGSEMLSLTGISFRSVHPVQVAEGIWPLAMLHGEERWPISLKLGAFGLQSMKALASGDPDAIDRSFDKLKRTASVMFPGRQAQKMIEFIGLAKNDWKQFDTRSRLRYESSKAESIKGLLGPTVGAQERYDEWNQISRMTSSYRRSRRLAIEAFMDGDLNRFVQLQERLQLNFGKEITEADIMQEVKLRGMTSVERQMIGLPAELRDAYFGD